MKKTTIYLSDTQHLLIKKLAKQDGIRASEHIRKALDEYLKKKKLIN